MSYRVIGLSADLFADLSDLTQAELAQRGVHRVAVDEDAGFPCRVTLEDAKPGETVFLLNYEHQPHGPFASRHAIFVREAAGERSVSIDALPNQLRSRLLSIRAFDAGHMMVDADVAEGSEAVPLIERFFSDDRVDYLHAHFARRGCYAARIERA